MSNETYQRLLGNIAGNPGAQTPPFYVLIALTTLETIGALRAVARALLFGPINMLSSSNERMR